MKKTRRIFSLIIVLIVMLFPCLAVQAKEVTAKDLMYITEESKPWNYSENGKITGFAVELLKLVWKEMDIQPQPDILLYPWARGYNQLEKRKNVALFSTSRLDHREKLFKWVCPIAPGTRYVFISKKEKNLKMSSFDEAKAYRVGSIREDVAEQIIKGMGFDEGKIQSTHSMEINLRKLDGNKIDMIAYDERAFFTFTKAMWEKNNKVQFNPDDYETVLFIKQTPLCYAFNKEVPDKVISELQGALAKVRTMPAYESLKKEFGCEWIDN